MYYWCSASGRHQHTRTCAITAICLLNVKEKQGFDCLIWAGLIGNSGKYSTYCSCVCVLYKHICGSFSSSFFIPWSLPLKVLGGIIRKTSSDLLYLYQNYPIFVSTKTLPLTLKTIWFKTLHQCPFMVLEPSSRKELYQSVFLSELECHHSPSKYCSKSYQLMNESVSA